MRTALCMHGLVCGLPPPPPPCASVARQFPPPRALLACQTPPARLVSAKPPPPPVRLVSAKLPPPPVRLVSAKPPPPPAPRYMRRTVSVKQWGGERIQSSAMHNTEVAGLGETQEQSKTLVQNHLTCHTQYLRKFYISLPQNLHKLTGKLDKLTENLCHFTNLGTSNHLHYASQYADWALPGGRVRVEEYLKMCKEQKRSQIC